MNSRHKKTPLHPGVYIRQSILPAELSVKKTAEMLGIGRPALSNFLNGRAALSPDMALRFEKAFQSADSLTLLEMQTRYDEFEARPRKNDIAVRAYARPYLQITARQIDAWAYQIEAREQLPALLRTLIHSTGTNLTAVDFPAFGNSQRKGWDGQVTSGSATPWIPRGESGWEFGCSQNPQPKAEKDYQARMGSVPAKERKSKTFVFVTPRNWQDKDSWAKGKKARNQWKDVRAFDASDLEQWLEQSIPAQIRMQKFLDTATRELTTLGQIWLEWAGATEPELPKALFTPAAERHQQQLEKWLNSPPARPFVVVADSALEALAFLHCALGRLGDSCPGTYERTVVIRSLKAFKAVAGISSNFVAIVSSSEVENALAGLHKETHTIIVRGRNTVSNNADIALDLLGREPFRNALSAVGLNDSRIGQLARESARSPTILRRRLAQIEAVKIPPWANDNTIARALIPLIFVGAWDSSVKADKEILHYFTDRPYEYVEHTIAQLQSTDEPPVWSIGSVRGVLSKVDAFYAIHRTFTQEDFEKFLFAAEIVLSEQDPALELPKDKRWAANLYGKSRYHSSELRKGLCDMLVLLAVHGNSLVGDRLGIDLEARVSCVIHRLLTPSAASTWLSQSNDLPQYAEAAPDKFLCILESDLSSEDPKIAELFVAADNGLFGDCPRSGMLWALEILAWKPERLVRVAVILARLCAWKIDDSWTNTPMETLKMIFRHWFPQTAASVEQRNKALEMLTGKFPDVGWQVCIDQFNPISTTGHFSRKPRWRTDAYDAGEIASKDEARQGQHKAIELALNWPEYDEHMLGDLIKCMAVLSPDSRNQVWELISTWNHAGRPDDQRAALRDQIWQYILTRRGRHREIDETARECARKACALLTPRDPVANHQWLFLRQWVHEAIGEFEDKQISYKKLEERIARQRRAALQEVCSHSGMDGVKELCRSGDACYVVGWHMAEITSGAQQSADFIQSMLAEISDELLDKCTQCIAGFLDNFDVHNRVAVLTKLLARLGDDDEMCIRLLCCAPVDNGTWQQVDQLPKKLKQRYWKEIVPRPGRHDATKTATLVDELLKVQRPRAAFDTAKMDWQVLDSPRLMRLLTEVATNVAEPSGHYRIDPYYVSTALETLEQRGDVSCDDLARLEFLFIRVLGHSKHGIRNLETQLSEKPALFMQVLAFAFERNDGKEDPAEWQLPNSKIRISTARAAQSILNDSRRIPGTMADDSIDLKKLKEWMEQVRTFTREYGRTEIGDEMIGLLLSHSPLGHDGVWPCEAVREAIEDIGSQEIAHGMLIGKGKTRGTTWRGEAGTQVHGLAEQFRRWSQELAYEYPYTANVLEKIATNFDQDAKWWANWEGVLGRLE